MGKPKASRDVEGDWRRQSEGKGDLRGGSRGETDGATSGARSDSKRVDPRPLANQEGQHQGFTRNKTAHVPEPSTPPTNDPKCAIHQPNLPRRRGQIKSRSRKIRRTKMRRLTYQVGRRRRGQIRRIKHIGDIAYEVQMLGSLSRQDTGAARHCRSQGYKIARSALPEPRLTIYGHRSTQPHTDAGLCSSFIQY